MTSPLALMGVVNITPDSFSDGGRYYSVESCQERINALVGAGVDYLDIGAESTAPFNCAITPEEEWRRYREIFFPSVENFSRLPSISIDTYRPETFCRVYGGLRERGFGGDIIWNDVSGIVDERTFEVLKRYPEISYVYTHNRVPHREETVNHRQYLREEFPSAKFLEEVEEYFYGGIEKLKSFLPLERIWLDPGLGFGKSIEQNWYLAQNLPDLVSRLNGHTFLVGISRKSFLQDAVKEVHPEGDGDWLKQKSEFLHALFYLDWRRELAGRKVVIRLHDPTLPALAQVYLHRREKKSFLSECR